MLRFEMCLVWEVVVCGRSSQAFVTSSSGPKSDVDAMIEHTYTVFAFVEE